MIDRLIELRKCLHLNQEAFGAPLNLSRAAIGSYEQGIRTVTDRTIADICRVYNVNEDWLRSGSGEMFSSATSVDAELSALIGELISSDDAWTKECIVRFLKLSPQSREAFKKFIADLFGN